MSKVLAQTKSIRELLSGVKYDIDFYQRGYDWQRRNVEELLNDFSAEFNANFSIEHEPGRVADYRHYFLGTIITISESGKRYIVDGQQRLTTITLLLIYIHHLRSENRVVFDVAPLIYSERFQSKSFTIAVKEREACMNALFEGDQFDASDHPDLSVRNLVERYEDLKELFPNSLKGKVLPYFTDWLIENVDLVEIEALTDDSAFTIFETMNDRGVNLSQADMLKGYLLSHINFADANLMHDRKTEANNIWKQRIREFVDVGASEEEEFFRSWLRGKHARVSLQRDRGTASLSYEKIDQFHRWVRDNHEELGLHASQDYFDFIIKNFNFFARYYLKMREASFTLTSGLEAIYYNALSTLSLQVQYMLALAPLRLDDNDDIATRKIKLVMAYLDIFVARKMVNTQKISYGSVWYEFFELAKRIRNMDLGELGATLVDTLGKMDINIDGVTWAHRPFQLSWNTPQYVIRYLLARMTAWVEMESGKPSSLLNFVNRRGNPVHLEHIWANKFERHKDEFDNEDEFQRQRNFFGGLVLLPGSVNQSFRDMPYEDKARHYLKENLLAASLHPMTYEKNPNFINFVKRSGLPFKPHPQFKKADILERQELYRQICERIWSPDRLLEDG